MSVVVTLLWHVVLIWKGLTYFKQVLYTKLQQTLYHYNIYCMGPVLQSYAHQLPNEQHEWHCQEGRY